MFDYQKLLLPWYIPVSQHWICVGIDMPTAQIRVYDSLNRHPQKHRHIYQVREYTMLFYPCTCANVPNTADSEYFDF